MKTSVGHLVGFAVAMISLPALAQTPADPSGRDMTPGASTARIGWRHVQPSTSSSATVFDSTLNVGVVPGAPLRYPAGQPDPHVNAASGIVIHEGTAYVIQDNTLGLGRQNRTTGALDNLALPTGADGARKFGVEYNNPAIKPDIEAIATTRDGKLVAFGSGDRPTSQVVWVIDPKTGATTVVDAKPFYEGLKARKDFSGANLNLEGAVVDGDRLLLFQRGNKPGKDGTPAINSVGEVSLSDALAGRAPKITKVKAYEMGEIDGVRLTFSDATRGPDGRIHFIASAEGKDGIKGSAIGYIDESGVARYGLVTGPDGKPAKVKLEGIAIDPKTGRVIAVDDADDVKRPSELYELEQPEDPRKNYQLPGSVTLVSWDKAGAIGMNAGVFKDGRWTWAEGRHGRIGMDVLRADGTGRAVVGVTREGLKADVLVQGNATLAGITGETGRYGIGAPDALSRAHVQGQGRAFVGADGQAVGTAHLTKSGVHLVGGGQVFAGAKAKGEIGGTISICGLAANASAQGEVSYGAGAGAIGFFKVDWAKGTVKMGGAADATLGLGAGAGGMVEVSVEQILRDPRMAGRCVTDGISSGYESIKSGVGRATNAVNAWLNAFSIFGTKPVVATGTAVPRATPTRAIGAGHAQPTKKAIGAGMARD